MALYFISGGPNSGKSRLVERLSDMAYLVVPEAARFISKNDKRFAGKNVGDIKNAGLMESFQNEIFKEQRRMLGAAKLGLDYDVFCDRGFPDSVAYYRYHGLRVPEELSILTIRFKSTAFMLELLDKDENDFLRTETPEQRLEIHQEIIRSYEDFGYPLIMVSKMTVPERANFILQKVKNL